MAAQRPSSSSQPNIGKSVTQRNVNASSSIRPSSRPRWRRRGPRTRDVASRVSAANSSVSPGAGASSANSFSERNFAIGERSSPFASRTRYARPFAPRSFAISSSAPSSARENVLGTRRKRTASACAKTPNPDPRVASVASSSSRANRVSGLSDPNRRSASANVMRGHGVSISTPRHSRQIAANISSIRRNRSSRSGNAISTSSCVISCTRSARRSSSRKQIAIW